MQTEELVGIATGEYRQNVQDMGYSIGTGILLVLVLVTIVGIMIRYLTTNISESIKDNKASIEKLSDTNTEQHKEICDALTTLKDKIAPITQWVNIDIKKKLNGDGDGDDQ